jgi:hypothetical protein
VKLLAALTGLAILTAASTGLAAKGSDEDAAPKAPESSKEVGEDSTFGHGFQFGLRAGILFGYRMMFRYDQSPLCKKFDSTLSSKDQIKSCGFGATPGTEVALSFAVLDGVEPYLFGRFGFSGEARTDTNPLQMFGVGARLYTMSDSRFKFFIEPGIAYETEGGASSKDFNQGFAANYKKDLVFHAGIGPQYDFAHAFGIYANGSIDVGVLRSINAALLLNIGAQVRFP